MRTLLTFLLAGVALTAAAQDPAAVRRASETALAFTRAIVDHDSLAVADLLAEDARILEGGAVETRAEYLAHHFHADAAFLGSMDREPLESTVRVAGDVAWVLSTTRLTGTFRDREVDAVSAETLILERHADTWKIASVHWSSGTVSR